MVNKVVYITCGRLLEDLLATHPTSPQQVVVMEFGKRHDTTDTTDFSRTNLLQTCYGETGVIIDFGLYATCARNVLPGR